MIRVLLIPSSDYLGHPFPQRHNHLFERLHDGKEFEVHVVRFNIFNKPKLASKCIIHEIPFEVSTRSTGLYYLMNTMSHVSEILRIIKRESIDIVFAGNLLPPLMYVLVRSLAELKVPFVFDVQDYYPTSATGYLADVRSVVGVALKGFFEVVTKYLICKADAVTVPGIALATYARRVGAQRVSIIPNGLSEYFLERCDGRDVRKRLSYNDSDVVVGYIGSIEFWLDMESLIKAVSIARTRGLPVKLLLIGKQLQTGYPLKVRKWLKIYRVENATTWLDFIPHNEVPRYVAAMDVATIPFDVSNPTAYYAAPNKLWEYLSQGTIVATTPIPEALVHRKIGRIYIVKTSEDYVRAFEEADRNRKKNIDPCLRQILKARLWSQSVEKLKALLKSLVLTYTENLPVRVTL